MEKGKLKIFFGYAPGVGKTYAMLREGHRLKRQGIDVVIGYFEPHARPDTIALSEGFETIPLREIDYKGIKLKEFDVDAAIKRHPQFILVDELAHTNAEGSKNRKRYLDVIELLNNGINVYTTVNVQHLEGLSDLVDSKLQVEVSERIPDDIFDFANEISIIDLEPDDLIERMKLGKIYKNERAKMALNNFFVIDNLTNLRELTMRRMADRLEKRKNNGLQTSKILVLVSPSPSSAKNIRVGARMAEAYHSKFTALYVETNANLSDEAAKILKSHMQLVRNLNGDMVVKYGFDPIETIASYVKIAGVTNLIIGKTWQSIGKKKISFENQIIQRLPGIEVLIVPDNQSVNSIKLNPIQRLIKNIFSSNKAVTKFKMTNKALDIYKTISTELQGKSKKEQYKKLVLILARAFERCIELIIDEDYYVAPYKSLDVSFFDSEHELAVAKWCYTNGKEAGKGTDTLRNSKATYFPIKNQKGECIAVIGMSCLYSKLSVTDRLLFMQIYSIIALIISLDEDK